jgi:hypothetical protein
MSEEMLADQAADIARRMKEIEMLAWPDEKKVAWIEEQMQMALMELLLKNPGKPLRTCG